MTLIEIVVVVAIVSLMTAAIGVSVLTVFKDSKRTLAKMAIRDALTALDTYRVMKGRYPPSQEGFQALVAVKAMKALPKDPWGTPLLYAEEGGEPVVRSLGADAQAGGAGDDADLSSASLDE
jgi:general secretion pathway protein G